ncbi:EndoU domain-containing protein [Nocardia tengchongensis]
MSISLFGSSEPPPWVAERAAAWDRMTANYRADPPGPGPRIHNITVTSPEDAVRKFDRIMRAKELAQPTAGATSPVVPDRLSALPAGGQPLLSARPISATPSMYYDGIPDGNANKQTPAPDPAPPVPNQPPAPQNPQPALPSSAPDVFRQMYDPNAEVPQPASPKTLTELAVPGGYTPTPQPLDPSTAVGQMYQQMVSPKPDPVSTPTTLAELAVPGYKEPPASTVTVTCTGSLPVTPGVPAMITKPTDAFRVGQDRYGFNYSAEQLAADLALVQQGRGQPGVYGPYDITIVTPYDLALQRLAKARYTPEEQNYDLQWAFYDPQDDDERLQQQLALTRLREIGINPYADPATEKYVKDQLSKAQYASDPRYPSTRNTPPPPPRPKMTTLGEDLYGMFVEPAVILWEATHGKGNHSGGQIAWAAAEFGLNASTFIPVVGTAANGARALRITAAEALAGTRLASALSSAKNAMEAATLGRQFGTQQVLADADRWAAAQRQLAPPASIGAPLEQAAGGINLGASETVKPPIAPFRIDELPPVLPVDVPPSAVSATAGGFREVQLAPNPLRSDVGLPMQAGPSPVLSDAGTVSGLSTAAATAGRVNPALTASPSWIESEFSVIAAANRGFAQSSNQLVEQITAGVKFENPALVATDVRALVVARAGSGRAGAGFNGGFSWAEGHGPRGKYPEGAALRRELEADSGGRPPATPSRRVPGPPGHAQEGLGLPRLLEPDDTTWTHVLKGEINEFGKPTGYHHRPDGKDQFGVKVTSRTSRDSNGVYRGTVNMNVWTGSEWKTKTAKSTFFPDEWTSEQVKRAIEEASRSGEILPGGKWRGAYRGIEIQGYYEESTGRVITGYPLWKGKLE